MAVKDSEAQFVGVSDLRIGMYVYLDLGWMQHPFTLNNFKITTHDQIDTILKLGINRIRWSPEKSDPPPQSEAPAAGDDVKVGAGGTAAVEATVQKELRRQRRNLLNCQRESLEVCEKQFASAARSYRQVIELVRTQPEPARLQAAQAISSMVGKMLEQEESAIRLLSENVGDKASLHSLNVTVISLLIGKAMGLEAAVLNELGTGALFHDIGKVELPERLRCNDQGFTNSERNLYQEHVRHGVTLGQTMKLTPGALAVIAQHHELIDGRGYPLQLRGDRMAPHARIVALVNHYDNLCNPANPALAMTPHEALSTIFAQMKAQFDPQVLTLFIRMMGVYPPGSVVELNDGRLALVVSVNTARPLKPNILIFDARTPRDEALVEDLEQAPNLCIRRSIKPLNLPKAAFDYLSPRQRMCYFFDRAHSNDDNENTP